MYFKHFHEKETYRKETYKEKKQKEIFYLFYFGQDIYFYLQ